MEKEMEEGKGKEEEEGKAACDVKEYEIKTR